MLAAAASAGPVHPIFVLDPEALRRHASPNRHAFLSEALHDLDASLQRLGGQLRILAATTSWVDSVTSEATRIGATAVHCSADFSGFAQRRLETLERALEANHCVLHRHPGVAAVPPGSVHTGSGTPFRVFTPYFRRWSEYEVGRPIAPATLRTAEPASPDDRDQLDAAIAAAAMTSPGRPRGGETEARASLRRWAARGLAMYGDRHNDLAGDATSKVAAALHFGCLSPREVVVRFRDRPGAAPFLRQLAWRDFFLQVLATRVDVAHTDLRPREFAWRTDDDAFAAWAEGRSGYPIVDAGMRQLRSEGFMHNRARMIVASFLTKDLAIDWRRGAAEFERWLCDGDIAQNRLNWQWVAGTGTDSNPHRIFNPTRQSERFDSNGDYIRRYVQELGAVAAPEIHDPPPLVRAALGYPMPIVDHAEAIAEYRGRLSGHVDG